ncbi:MAG: phosphodiester glycosidase family protein [Hyphomonas sp.]|uniref:phosphodiester glycosidase family protein n=1 Tax=Hyphomonas sp. TaxID=87 RepID=UPI003528F3E9
MRRIAFALIIVAFLAGCREEAEPSCAAIRFEDQPFTVCHFDAGDPGLALFHTHPDGAPYGDFDRLAEEVSSTGGTLVFAMNAGMYHEDRRPVGLYVEDGEQAAGLVTRAGPGNFGMLPNGVFWIDENGAAHISETLAYEEVSPAARYASQSGPMLVIGGALHPSFNEDGTSRKRRNGAGISADGRTVWFAISDAPVNFHTFARLFRDELGTSDALYFDGVVSRLYAPELARDDGGADMGPIVGVVRRSVTK